MKWEKIDKCDQLPNLMSNSRNVEIEIVHIVANQCTERLLFLGLKYDKWRQ